MTINNLGNSLKSKTTYQILMKEIKILILVFFSVSAYTQISTESDLFRDLKIQDSILFERGFNQCDLEYLNKHISESVSFYHDQAGYQDKAAFFENTKKYICSNLEIKRIRQVDANSLEVFPLNKNGELYGAIQKGIHHFYLREKGKTDIKTSIAKFTHVWVLEGEIWKLHEVLSYDHQNPPEDSDLEKENIKDMTRQIATFLTFQKGDAEQAMNLYMELFENSSIVDVKRWGAGAPGKEGSIMHATFKLNGNLFMCSDSPAIHDWDFTPAVSNYVDCEDEDELERLFKALSKDGKIMMPLNNYGFSQKFGFVEDKFGVSWQLNLK